MKMLTSSLILLMSSAAMASPSLPAGNIANCSGLRFMSGPSGITATLNSSKDGSIEFAASSDELSFINQKRDKIISSFVLTDVQCDFPLAFNQKIFACRNNVVTGQPTSKVKVFFSDGTDVDGDFTGDIAGKEIAVTQVIGNGKVLQTIENSFSLTLNIKGTDIHERFELIDTGGPKPHCR